MSGLICKKVVEDQHGMVKHDNNKGKMCITYIGKWYFIITRHSIGIYSCKHIVFYLYANVSERIKI